MEETLKFFLKNVGIEDLSEDMSFSGRLALVTGGGSGIGKAVCHALAEEGTVVVAADINLDAAWGTVAELKGEAHVALHVDVADAASVASLIDSIGTESTTPLRIVVHCAGVAAPCGVVDMPEDYFDKCLRVNLKGTFLINQAAVKVMLKSEIPEGCIVNIASILGKTGIAYGAAYAASKGGVIAFTKSLAQELAGTNIRVNALLPGYTDTPMTAVFSEKRKKGIIDMSLMSRFARPEEVANVAKFLCSSGSSYITGTCVEVAAGMFA